MIFEAILFAAERHSGQYRKGSRVPFIVHPLNVSRTLIECGCREAVAVAGVLHDIVEDTATTLEEIRQRFGDDVAALVAGATDLGKLHSWEERKEHTLLFLRTAPQESLLLALADKLDNIHSIHEQLPRKGERVWTQFHRPREIQRWYYESLGEIFAVRLTEEPGRTLAKRFADEVVAVFPPG